MHPSHPHTTHPPKLFSWLTLIFSGLLLLAYPAVFMASAMSYANPSHEPWPLFFHHLFLYVSVFYPLPILTAILTAWSFRQRKPHLVLWLLSVPWLTFLGFLLSMFLHFRNVS